jgi:hypothetical protein
VGNGRGAPGDDSPGFHGQTGGQDIDFRDLWTQKNAMLNFIVTAMMENPDETLRRQAETLVEDAVCMLKRFPTNYRQTRHDNSALEVACISELYGPLTAETISVADRCPSPFVWWSDPAEIEACQENLKAAYPPTGFLLPYWMGRYFGLIRRTCSEDASTVFSIVLLKNRGTGAKKTGTACGKRTPKDRIENILPFHRRRNAMSRTKQASLLGLSLLVPFCLVSCGKDSDFPGWDTTDGGRNGR